MEDQAGHKKHKKHKKKRQRPQRSQRPQETFPLKTSIALLGFRGVGKSTIATRLAQLRPAKVISLDEEIQKSANMSIADITTEFGWAKFRELEKEKLREIAAMQEIIILDTGGGILEDEFNNLSQEKVDLLKESFFCIYLTMPDDLLLKRLNQAKKSMSRPALPGGDEALMSVLARRKPMYLKASHAVVDISDVPPQEAAMRISQVLRNR